ncbi:hypothetical protein [Planotetraspora kaengkrachanensis]|uniref:Uncharacterized protein n=1 Tax=Planotetraspora kaengkrachanensis TaxID=575193 RepID=A0A8J3PZ33_9ACTN|nr:hypothetical protein [Planotetraspora kaengkrachanensis]GIG83556.1 hypothetical protein Pka01_66830 [Planotetraspora kaengkrachanensis]
MAVVLIIITLGILLGLLARRIRARRATTPLTIAETTPTFNVVALGLQGSGKTLLLASMYHRLKSPAGQCYFITATRDDVLQLNEWYLQMADTAATGAWPRGTAKGETRHFTFTVKTHIDGAPHPILNLRYLEYAGELLTDLQDAGSTKQKELFAHIDSADALIGVLDGYRIRQHADGHPEGPLHLERTLNALLPVMLEASAPISFVITKWDLLADLHPDEDTRLSIVRNLLTSNDHFRSLITLHGATRVVRLIPVSAVGPGFATIDPNGEIVKTPQGAVQPTNVDVPLSAVVPGLFEQIESRLDHDSIAAIRAEVDRRTRQGALEAFASLTTFAGQLAGRTVLALLGTPTAAFGDTMLGFFLDSRMGTPPDEDRARLSRELNDAEQRLENIQLARRRVMYDMRRKVDALEGRLPYSRLTEGGW